MPDFEYNFNDNDYNIVATREAGSFGDVGDYIRLTIRDAANNVVQLGNGNDAIFYSGSTDLTITTPGISNNYGTITSPADFDSFTDPTGNLYIKPNEVLSSSLVPQGNYTLQVDFLNQYKPSTDGGEDEFVVKQISPSRLEVRLKLFSTNISDPISEFLSHLGDPYQFNHVLYIGKGRNIPIVNYTFDKFTDGEDKQSIILKLYEPLPSDIRKLHIVTVEREVLITQTQNIYYMSSIPSVRVGAGLNIDDSSTYTNQQGSGDITWQSYTDLTSGSVDSTTINNLISGSSFDYPNLNIDYNSFSNHTFFGSVVKKLENFKTKVSTLEDYYSEISSSLSATGNAIDGDTDYVINRRKDLFDKIQNEINSLTPYERFLYYDNQSQTTQSAPSLGDNYTDTTPVSKDDNFEELNNYDGFNIVYKNSNSGYVQGKVNLFHTKYKVHEKPFFNYSGSVYLSFLLKGTKNLELVRHNDNHNVAGRVGNGVFLPYDATYTASLQLPTITGSEYRRVIYEASASYWAPTSEVPGFDLSELSITAYDFDPGSTKIEILSGSIKTGSSQIKDSSRFYQNFTTVVTQSGVPFYGSVMPAGELFSILYTSGSGTAEVTSSYVTDVKVTFNDPSDTLPFSYMYNTDSSTWTNWYDILYSQAETYDNDNINSLINNLPTYIQESTEYDDLKTFLNMNGEHFDLIRNHIDNYSSVYNRGYNELDSVPKNLMPILADNLGWELITPFTGSLESYFGTSVSSVTTTDDIRHNTWRKSLNNLIYLYKSKGTKNAVRALLNIYGYPPDVIGISEFGGSSEEQIDNTSTDTINPWPAVLSDNFDNIKDGISIKGGNVSFVLRQKKLINYMFSNNSSRILNMDWWMNNANPETVEFVYKHKKTTNTQEILKSSGSGTTEDGRETLWDLRLVPSGDGLSSSFAFRLNNSRTGSFNITASNCLSMSTAYNNMSNGQLWNVMLQRMTSSISGSRTNEYKLATAFQDKDKITILSAISMSVSGGLTRDTNYNANENWQSSGSRHYLSSSNLVVGRTLSGSLAEFRTWTTTLSASKFKQHSLNKQSVVGNNITAHKDELIYHYRLNENWTTSSLNPKIQDANPKGPKTNPTNYDISLSTDLLTGAPLYGHDTIDTYAFTLRTNSSNQEDDNKILINPKRTFSGQNLNPREPSILPLSTERSTAPRINSSKLEITNSPTDFINDFIINNISDSAILNSYIKPSDNYSSSYADLDTFRDDFFKNYNITIDTNKFIRAHENIWNQSAISAIKKIVPARSTLSDSSVGVTIKPHILEHQKVEKKKPTLQYGETGLFSSELNGKAADLSDTIDIVSRIDILETYETTKDGIIDINEKTSLSESSYEATKDSEISIDTLITETGTYDATKDSEIDIDNLIVEEMSYESTKDIEISSLPTTNGEYVTTKDSNDVDYHSTHWIQPFRNLHNEWGTGDTDTHFLNMASTDSGSLGDYNVGHIDDRFVFRMIGDVEVMSASFYTEQGYNPNPDIDFNNPNIFLNREVRDNGKGYTYNSYINGNPGPQDGRPVGKTSYYTSSADGQLLFPSNHWSKFSRDDTDRWYKGTLNTNPGFLNVQAEDYSSASFYRVIVTGGENELVVKSSGQSKKGDDDKIIY